MNCATDIRVKQPTIDPAQPETLVGLEEEIYIGFITRLYSQNLQLSELLQAYVQERYGQKTERFEDPGQLRLFEDQDAASCPEQTNDENQEMVKPKRKGSSRQRKPRASHLKIQKIPARHLTEEDFLCACCGKTRIKINEVVVHSRYEFIPSSISIQETIEEILACPDCDGALVSAEISQEVNPAQATEVGETIDWEALMNTEAGKDSQLQAEDPLTWACETTLATMKNASEKAKRCQATAGMMAYISTSKYCDHMPLYRMEEILARQGADISSSTMCGWLSIVSEILRGIYELMQRELLLSKVIKTDDTPVKVLDKKTKKNIKTGRIWVYIGDEQHPYILFHYTQGRGRAGPKEFLKEYRRYLQGDCFSGNEAICAENGAVLVACNAHARRYFKKALLNYKKKSEEALRVFQRLFEIERTAKELALSADDVKRMREQEAKPIWDEFKIWLEQEHLVALPKSAFGKAVSYCLNNWEALTAYQIDGDLCIDNNQAEQQMKRIATGRKAWLFFGSDNGGECAEVLMSIIATCKMHGVEPWAYLKDVIETLTIDPQADLRALLPTQWKAKSKAEAERQSAKCAVVCAQAVSRVSK